VWTIDGVELVDHLRAGMSGRAPDVEPARHIGVLLVPAPVVD
jgi:hypothetical protein